MFDYLTSLSPFLICTISTPNGYFLPNNSQSLSPIGMLAVVMHFPLNQNLFEVKIRVTSQFLIANYLVSSPIEGEVIFADAKRIWLNLSS